jgi:cilia- and flagella-associated protein 44
MDSYKRFNLHLIEPHVLIYANGNVYEFYDMMEKTRKVLFGKDTDGIGSIAVHPSRKYFAVAEKGNNPNIYIYDYPDLKLYRICKNGTEKAYSHVEFSIKGDKLASVGSAPDYTITVWNWKSQRVILKSKAFSQEVYRVSFSPYTDGVLVTSGMGHIKFWKMANTFTGLKLKGELGKYGKLELSDVTGFRELPDGKVVSGTEYGTMILWEGRNIKAHLVQDDEAMTPLHDGFLEIVILQNDEFITAGEDGFIKFWNFSDIDSAEFSDEKMEVVIKPIREISVKHDDGTPAHINQMIKEGDRWILGDARGKIWEINLETEDKIEIMNFHSGPIADLGVCERKNVAVTIGSDGVIKCWDFINEKEIFSKKCAGSGTCMDWLPYTENNKGRIIACGFDTGVARIFSVESDRFKLLNSVKSLDFPMVKIKYSPDGNFLATVGKDGSIFFFGLDHEGFDKLDPVCMYQSESEINDCTWDINGKKFLIACKNGIVYEIDKPDQKKVDVKESFLVELKSRSWQIKMMEFQMKKNQKKDEAELEKIKRMRLRGELPMEEEEEEDEDWDPEAILTVRYTTETSDKFIITATGLYAGYYYICSFDNERPLKAVDMPKGINCTYFDYSVSRDFIIAGLQNGSYLVWSSENTYKYMEIKVHDAHSGAIKAAKFNPKENYILSVGNDGLLNVQRVNKEAVKMYAQALVPGDDISFVSEMEGFETMETEIALKARDDESEDITDPEAVSIQEQKLRNEEYWRMKKAEERKADVRNKINLLREEFNKL